MGNNIDKASTTTPVTGTQHVPGAEQPKTKKTTKGPQGTGYPDDNTFGPSGATPGPQHPTGTSKAPGPTPPAPGSEGGTQGVSDVPKWILDIKNETPYIITKKDGKLRLEHRGQESDAYLISINPSNSFDAKYNEAVAHCIGSLLQLVAAHGNENGGIRAATFTGNSAKLTYNSNSAPQTLGGDDNVGSVSGEEIRKNLKLLGDVMGAMSNGHQGGAGAPHLEMHKEVKQPEIDLHKQDPVVASKETAKASVAGSDELADAVGAVAQDASNMLKEAWLARRQFGKAGTVDQRQAALQDIVKKKESYERKLEELKVYNREPSTADRELHARLSTFINGKTAKAD